MDAGNHCKRCFERYCYNICDGGSVTHYNDRHLKSKCQLLHEGKYPVEGVANCLFKRVFTKCGSNIDKQIMHT